MVAQSQLEAATEQLFSKLVKAPHAAHRGYARSVHLPRVLATPAHWLTSDSHRITSAIVEELALLIKLQLSRALARDHVFSEGRLHELLLVHSAEEKLGRSQLQARLDQFKGALTDH